MDARKPFKPKYVDAFRDRYGKERFYFRRKGGPRIALEGELGTEQFDQSYRAAMVAVAGGLATSKMVGGIKPGNPLIGVYLLMFKGKLIYIGSSLNMPRRVQHHRSNGRPFDEAFYIATKANRRQELERELIKALYPAQNSIHRFNWRNGSKLSIRRVPTFSPTN